MPSPRFDHVIFDLDGTLIDSRADLAASVNRVRRRLSLPPLPLDTVCGYIGEGARLLVLRALGPDNEHRIDEALPLFMADYRAHLLDATRTYEGLPEALERLRARGIALSVLSNKPEEFCRAILAGLGLLAHFVAVVGGDTLGARKPDPAGVHYLRALTQTAPERLLVVGDSRVDWETARAAGVAFCAVAWGLRPNELRDLSAPMIEHADDLLSLVG